MSILKVIDENNSSPDKRHVNSSDITLVDSSARDLDKVLMEVKEQRRMTRKRRRHHPEHLGSNIVQHTTQNAIQHSAAEFLAGTKTVIDDNEGEGVVCHKLCECCVNLFQI
jgi:hypothetical protein